MNPGLFDVRVTFTARGEGPDGPRTGDFVTVLRTSARWQPASSMPAIEAGTVSDVVGGVLTIRDTPPARALLEGDRVSWNGQDFEISSTPVPDRSQYMRVTVQRRLGSGP